MKRLFISICFIISIFLVGCCFYSLVKEDKYVEQVYAKNPNLIDTGIYTDKDYSWLYLQPDSYSKKLDVDNYKISQHILGKNKMHGITFHKFSKNISLGNFFFSDIIKNNQAVHISFCLFPDSFSITNMRFQDNFNLSSSAFGKINFSNLNFDKSFYFDFNVCQKDIVFTSCNFFKKSSFDRCVFKKSVSFEKSSIDGNVIFRNVIFNNFLNLSDLKLNDSSKIFFDRSRLADTLDFSSNNRIFNEIDLTVANFNIPSRYSNKNTKEYKRHYIQLFKSDISKFHIDYTHFKLLKKYYYADKWIDIPYDEMCGIYEGLLNNFRTRGQQESYKLLDVEYRDYKWQHSKTPWMSEVERLWWNYGYDKQLIFKWAIVFLLSFTLITFLFLRYFNSVYKLQKLTDLDRFSFSNLTIKTLFIKWWYAFVYSAAIFFGLTLKIENIEYKKFWGTLYIVFMYTSGIICLAYMANFVIQN